MNSDEVWREHRRVPILYEAEIMSAFTSPEMRYARCKPGTLHQKLVRMDGTQLTGTWRTSSFRFSKSDRDWQFEEPAAFIRTSGTHSWVVHQVRATTQRSRGGVRSHTRTSWWSHRNCLFKNPVLHVTWNHPQSSQLTAPLTTTSHTTLATKIRWIKTHKDGLT